MVLRECFLPMLTGLLRGTFLEDLAAAFEDEDDEDEGTLNPPAGSGSCAVLSCCGRAWPRQARACASESRSTASCSLLVNADISQGALGSG